MGTTYKIYPPIGIARLGNSPDDFFVGPEAPGQNFLPQGTQYKDGMQRIKRQGARFRIYECTFDDAAPDLITAVREISSNEAEIEWSAHLANTKSASGSLNSNTVPRSKLEIDPGNLTISGNNQNQAVSGSITITDDNGQDQTKRVKLGDLKTDSSGRLIVLGGHGLSESVTGDPISGLFSNGWYDDASDGPVAARVKLNGSTQFVDAESAWVVVGPPAYAHPIFNIVTMFDLAFDLATKLPPPNNFAVDPVCSFTKDIYPILRRTVDMQWVSQLALGPHGGPGNFLESPRFQSLHDQTAAGAATARKAIFDRLKDPANGGSPSFPVGAPAKSMPQLASLSLTDQQYMRFEAWKDGNFVDDWNGVPANPSFSSIAATDQPAALTRAALEAGVGGSFRPGIEVGGIFSAASTFQAPFRISNNLRPGSLTASLSVPWQADFEACGTGWWPGGRPNFVMNDSGQRYNWIGSSISPTDLVTVWKELGFITQDGSGASTRFIEKERTLPI